MLLLISITHSFNRDSRFQFRFSRPAVLPRHNGDFDWKFRARRKRREFQNVAIHFRRTFADKIINRHVRVGTGHEFHGLCSGLLIGNFRKSEVLFRANLVSRRNEHVRLLNRRFVFLVAWMRRGKDKFILPRVRVEQCLFLETNRKSIRAQFFKRPANAVNRNGVAIRGVAERGTGGKSCPLRQTRAAGRNRVVKRAGQFEGHAVRLRLKFQCHLQVRSGLRSHLSILNVTDQLRLQTAISRFVFFRCLRQFLIEKPKCFYSCLALWRLPTLHPARGWWTQ